MPKGVRRTFEEKVSLVEALNCRLTLVADGGGVDKPHTFLCQDCQQEVVQPLSSILYRGRVYCKTAGCSNNGRDAATSALKEQGGRPVGIPSLWARTSMEAIQAALAGHGLTLLPFEYQNANTRIPFICTCGERGTTCWTTLQQQKVRPCCPSCQDSHRPRGEMHPRWNPELTEEERQSGRPVEVINWYRRVLNLADLTCAISGEQFSRNQLSAHHIYGYSGFPHLRTHILNGVCIHRDLHAEFHAQYGQDGKNTYAQFAEFYLNHTGKEWYGLDPNDSN